MMLAVRAVRCFSGERAVSSKKVSGTWLLVKSFWKMGNRPTGRLRELAEHHVLLYQVIVLYK